DDIYYDPGRVINGADRYNEKVTAEYAKEIRNRADFAHLLASAVQHGRSNEDAGYLLTIGRTMPSPDFSFAESLQACYAYVDATRLLDGMRDYHYIDLPEDILTASQ